MPRVQDGAAARTDGSGPASREIGRLARVEGAPAKRRPQRFGRALQASAVAWALMLPALVALAAVSFYPILNGIWLSLTNTSLITNASDFVGLVNYANLANDGQFWNAWIHTVVFTAVSTGLETVIGLGMALLLFESFTGRSVIRAAMLVPWAMPTVVTSKMFGWLFDGQHGVVNYILVRLGILSSNVIGSARRIRRSAPSFWRMSGRRRPSWRYCCSPGCRRFHLPWSRPRALMGQRAGPPSGMCGCRCSGRPC